MVVGILVDANDHIDQRWEQLTAKLKEAAIELPQHPEPNGTILPGLPDGVPRRPRVGVWLMPDNHSAGELEDFVEDMIPENDPAWLCASGYIKCIPEEQRSFKKGKSLRAQIHAWLATREIPGRIGAAISAGDLQTDGALAQRFIGWLDRLYSIESSAAYSANQ